MSPQELPMDSPANSANPAAGNNASSASLGALPNEILALILEPLPITHLLPLLGVNSRFYENVRSIIFHRLRDTLSSASTDLILECFDERDRLSAPSFSCRYVETTSPSRYPTHAPDPEPPSYSPLWWHTWFRIVERSGETWWPRPRHPTPTTPPESPSDVGAPTKDVFIEEGAGDVSLTFRAFIAIESPMPTHHVVWEQVLAVSREWFAQAAASNDEVVGGVDCSDDRSILWVGPGRNCGVRVRVRPLEAEAPVLISVDEQPAVSYRMEYDALIMRSMLPLIKLDRTFLETVAVDAGALAVVPVPQ